MKKTIKRKLATWTFLGKSAPPRIFPARKGRAEYRDRSYPRRPKSLSR